MFQEFHEETGEFLIWLTQQTDYHSAVLFKNFIGDIFSLLAGFTIAFIIYVYLVKDARIVIDQNTEHALIARLKKNGHTRIYITLPPRNGNHLKLIMTIALFFNVILVRILPIKQIKFVKKYTIYIIFWTFIVIVFLLFITGLSLDSHAIFPDGKGGYKLE